MFIGRHATVFFKNRHRYHLFVPQNIIFWRPCFLQKILGFGLAITKCEWPNLNRIDLALRCQRKLFPLYLSLSAIKNPGDFKANLNQLATRVHFSVNKEILLLSSRADNGLKNLTFCRAGIWGVIIFRASIDKRWYGVMGTKPLISFLGRVRQASCGLKGRLRFFHDSVRFSLNVFNRFRGVFNILCQGWELNPRPSGFQPDALPLSYLSKT